MPESKGERVPSPGGGKRMRRSTSVSKVVFVLVIVAVIALGTMAFAGKGGGKKPPKCPNWNLVCPDVWDPVICDDGKTYSNQCYADRACATGCEPTGGGPVPLPM